ncbi:hypothetical protein [Stackebrandtia soli]|uniref:Rv0361 family membrane protein n=1 Tax=Stackebrandtia soli TaxID=1892856 RepID=UPI0039E84707
MSNPSQGQRLDSDGEPDGLTPPAKKKAPLFFGVGAMVVLVAVLITIALTLVGGNGSPSQVVEEYFDATTVDEVNALTCRDHRSDPATTEVGDLIPTDTEDVDLSWEIGDERITGERATVPVVVTGEADDSLTLAVQLIQEDGWKVCGFDFE